MGTCVAEHKRQIPATSSLHDGAVSKPCLSPEIVAALEEVQYNIGFQDGQNAVHGEKGRGAPYTDCQEFAEMVMAAETFFQRLIKVIPESGILEHRLGWDSTTGNTTTLTTVSREYAGEITAIQELSSVCELDMIKKYDYDCFFWVVAEEELDRWLVVHDFPYVRTKTNHVHV